MPVSTTPSSAVVCTGLGFDWPDGTTALAALDLTLGAGRSGLIGDNGSGKSTLLRLIAGELTPTRGTVHCSADVAYLPQDVSRAGTVADCLGIATRIDALRAITAGDPDPAHFAALDDDWEVETRAVAALARLGLPADGPPALARPMRTLSGGEAVLVGVAGVLLRRPVISLLDEPTNNLDGRARELLYTAVDGWPGVLVVVSHDRELLERVDRIVEVRERGARTFGGTYSSYAQAIAAEQEAAARTVRVAEDAHAREKRQLIEAQVKLARRKRYADTAQREKRVPKIVAHARKGQAQVTAAKYRQLHEARLAEASEELDAAEQAVRDDDRIRIDLPATAVPAGRTVLTLGPLGIRGPERIAVVGDNGSGKTTLLDALAGRRTHPFLTVPRPPVPVGYLPQRLWALNDAVSVLDNVRAAAPAASPHDVRAQLARFLVRGSAVGQRAGTLSGGERFRVSLACVLLADPAPQLLLLDEPTNNLDLASVEQLVSALQGYRGALLVASHDRVFLDEIGVRREWQVDAPDRLPVERDVS